MGSAANSSIEELDKEEDSDEVIHYRKKTLKTTKGEDEEKN